MTHQDKQNTRIDHLIIVVPDLQARYRSVFYLTGEVAQLAGDSSRLRHCQYVVPTRQYLSRITRGKREWAGSRYRTNAIGRARLWFGRTRLWYARRNRFYRSGRARSTLWHPTRYPDRASMTTPECSVTGGISFGILRPRGASSRFVSSTARPPLCQCQQY